MQLSFSTIAVIMARTRRRSFYVRAARAGFAGVDRALDRAVVDSAGSRCTRFPTVPLAGPRALSPWHGVLWARSLGRFGATIMFAGNLQGVSQTLPLAVYLNLDKVYVVYGRVDSVLNLIVGRSTLHPSDRRTV